MEESKNLDLEETKEKIEYLKEDRLIQERKEKVFSILKKQWVWILGILIIILIIGAYIRSLPMTNHNGHPGLWDITKNTWTLGPDLDPYLFLRNAKIIAESGSLSNIDYMRNVPLGYDNSGETKLLPYMLVYLYKFLHFFNDSVSIEYSAIIFPIIMFVLTILAFFLLVREIFIKENKKKKSKAEIIALISCILLTVIPVFLPRTIAGIPEKESAAFFFMFLTFYLFLKAWKSEKLQNYIILGICSGIATALTGLVWGGVIYIFVIIGTATFLSFMMNKIHKKEALTYSSWLLSSSLVLMLSSNKYSLIGLLQSISTAISFFTLFLILVHFVIWKTKIHKINFIQNMKLSKNLISLLALIIIILVLILLAPGYGTGFIIGKIRGLFQTFINPIVGRWTVTVAENRQPYFSEWASEFGPFLKNIPILFWLFLIGSVVLFKNITNKLRKKDSWILTILFFLFLFGLIFSRYAPHPSLLDGEGTISLIFYFVPALVFLICLFYYFKKYDKRENNPFKELDYNFIFLFIWFVLCLFTARSAIRLIMVLAPVAVIFPAYLIITSFEMMKKAKEEIAKIFLITFFVLVLLLSLITVFGEPIFTKTNGFYQTVKSQAYNYIPSYYNQQWQKAMQWVREDTPKNSVFGHWWDYGYWVQTIGERPTVIDGGNSITYWNYLMGRLVLTGDNQKNSLEFLYNHNTSYLLIDSSDIGKYTAFSSIGSNQDYDRYSWIQDFILDEKQIQETNNQTIYVYSGGSMVDEDFVINEDNKQILIPRSAAFVGAVILPFETKSNNGKNQTASFNQPYIIAIYQDKQYKVNLRYLYISAEDKFIDFKTGIEGTAYIFPKINSGGNGANVNNLGACMYLSPRLMRGFLAQKYLLNDPFNKFPNFKLEHTETNLIIDYFRKQGANLPDFVLYNGVEGPIKIWKVEYNGDEQIKQEYLDRDYTKYINWTL